MQYLPSIAVGSYVLQLVILKKKKSWN